MIVLGGICLDAELISALFAADDRTLPGSRATALPRFRLVRP
jgi:hypothetical protein